jgi:hypothetical protein
MEAKQPRRQLTRVALRAHLLIASFEHLGFKQELLVCAVGLGWSMTALK